MEKILRIDMGAEGGPSFSETPLGEYAGLGGRAITSAIIAREVPPDCHPLGADNKLVIAPGLLSGSAGAQSGRISVGCKSPLTGGIKEANSGGQAGQVLARIGYAAIILEGKPPKNSTYKIEINKDGVTISEDSSIAGLGNYDLTDKIKGEYGDKVACISIGPAGEMKLGGASVAFTDPDFRPTRHAGRGGVGAVMGAKGVKVIILDDEGCGRRQAEDPEAFKDANQRFVKGLRDHAVTGQGLPGFGTNVLVNVVNEAGAFPTRNFKEGRFEGASKISGETMAEQTTARGGNVTHGCHKGCVIRCSGEYRDKDGNWLTKQPEYETVWAHGANCGIDDLDVIAQLDRMDDDLGLDTIEMGNAIAVAMDAGLAEFGDCEAAINLLEEVRKGTPLGRIIGNGAGAVGKMFGVEKVPVVKNQALPAYDPRAVQGIGVTYATSPQGGDHTAGYAVATNLMKVGGDVDPLKPEGNAELSRNLQIATASIDASGFCLFIAFAILDQPETFQAMLDMVNSFYGWNWTADDWGDYGTAILKNERDFNKRAGFTKHDDRLPAFFSKEPLSPHGVKFAVTDEELDGVFNF